MYLPGTHTFMIECLLSFFLEICLYFPREKFYTYLKNIPSLAPLMDNFTCRTTPRKFYAFFRKIPSWLSKPFIMKIVEKIKSNEFYLITERSNINDLS